MRLASPVICEVEVTTEAFIWRLGVTAAEEQRVLTSLRQALPDVQAEIIDLAPTDFDVAWELRLSSQRECSSVTTPSKSLEPCYQLSKSLVAMSTCFSAGRSAPGFPAAPCLVPRTPTGTTRFSTRTVKCSTVSKPKFSEISTRKPYLVLSAELPSRQLRPLECRVLRQGVLGGIQLLRASGGASNVGLYHRLGQRGVGTTFSNRSR